MFLSGEDGAMYMKGSQKNPAGQRMASDSAGFLGWNENLWVENWWEIKKSTLLNYLYALSLVPYASIIFTPRNLFLFIGVMYEAETQA